MADLPRHGTFGWVVAIGRRSDLGVVCGRADREATDIVWN